MDPSIWGRHGWIFMHAITLTYPDVPKNKEKNDMKTFFLSMGKVLPCMKCRNNFKDHLIKYPLDDEVLMSRDNLVKWLINIHNEVNIINNKPTMKYNDVIKEFIDRKHDSNNEDEQIANTKLIITKMLFVVSIVLIIISILVYFTVSFDSDSKSSMNIDQLSFTDNIGNNLTNITNN